MTEDHYVRDFYELTNKTMARNKWVKDEALIEVLWNLIKLRELSNFCNNKNWTYTGNYQQPYLSNLYNGHVFGSVQMNRCIKQDG